MQDGLSAQVGGPSTIFPRGFVWQIPIWYLAAAAGLVYVRWPPIWFRVTAGAGLLGATLTLLVVLSTLRVTGLNVDDRGVWLGLRPSTKRRGKHRRQSRFLPWHHVERVRLRARSGGVRVEFILGQDAPFASYGSRHGPIRRLWRWLLLFIPFWYLLRPTGVATPFDRPPRYRVTVRGKTIDELRRAMRAIAPPEVAVAVLVRRA